MSLATHLQAFLKDPKGVAALTPTSRASINRIVAKAPVADARLIVEFGPGSGVLTRALLERMPPEGRLVAIEANADLADRMTAGFDDRRLRVVHDSAERVGEILAEMELGPADCIFSGIPFFWLSPEVAHQVVSGAHAALAADGVFLTYQMIYQPHSRLRVHLERCFRVVRTEFDFRNLPPQRICAAVK